MFFTKNIIRNLVIVAVLCIVYSCSYAQIQDSTRPSRVSAASAALGQDTLVSYIVKKVESYSFKIKRDQSTIKRDIKVAPIKEALPSIKKTLDAFGKRLNEKGRPMNLRGLNTSEIILQENSDRLLDLQSTLNDYFNTLVLDNISLKQIRKDKLLRTYVSDTSLRNQMQSIIQNAIELDSTQKSILAKVTVLKNKVSVILLQSNDIISEIKYLTANVKIRMWGQEDESIFEDRPSEYNQSLTAITLSSLYINAKVLGNYLSNKWDSISFAFLLFVFIVFWCYSNIRRVKKMPEAKEVLAQVFFLKRSVFAGCLMVFFTYLPFFFQNSQMSFLHTCELLRLISLSYLLYPFLSKSFKPIWFIFCLLWLYLALDDLLLDPALAERWMLIIADILLIIICIKILKNINDIFIKVANSPATKPLVIFCMAISFLSLLFNISGRPTLAKILGVTAIQSLFIGITLKVFSTIVIESIYLQSEAYKESKFSEFINFKILQHRLKKFLWFVAIIVWGISLLIDFDLYAFESNRFNLFLNANRAIGNMNFTYASVAIFIGIIWLSSIISSIVNFFFNQQRSKDVIKKNTIGSMMLLIRLAIWSIGFIIAVAAAGIPLDKISIMLGALGVGIGFGLQNITNNLVSGIILAFERPIQIGDHIEIGNKAGVVDEIGVRSSKIKSFDGSDIIVPNGDFLSQHVINWTKQDRRKRLNFVIGVSYDSNLNSVKEIIEKTIEANENVLKENPPIILVHDFGASAINIDVFFWVEDLFIANSTKTRVMIEVYDNLIKNKIVIPYPIVTVLQENKETDNKEVSDTK